MLFPLQVENSRKAYRAAQSPEEAKVVKRQEKGNEPTRRRPAPLQVEAEDAAAAQHTRGPRRTSSNRGVKLRPMPSSSKQVSICFHIPLSSPLVIVRGFRSQYCNAVRRQSWSLSAEGIPSPSAARQLLGRHCSHDQACTAST